jgi:hypothetical protein
MPWWGTVINYHGTEPLLNAAATGKKLIAVFNLLFFVFTEEPYATVIAILGLIGVAYSIIRKEYLLPLWMVIPFFVEGRSAAGPAALPLAMLAAVGLADVIFPALQGLVKKDRTEAGQTEAGQADQVSSVERNIFFYLLLYLVFSAYQFGFQLSAATLYSPDEEAMYWVRDNTPADSRFLVLTGTTSVSCDSVTEWFPALTGRQSLFTVQGTEWTKGDDFGEFIKAENDLQVCSDENPSCIDELVDPGLYDYVYLSKLLRVDNCRPASSPRIFPNFVESVHGDERFEVVYETDDVMIYKER